MSESHALEKVRCAARRFVEEQLPEEARLFDAIWEVIVCSKLGSYREWGHETDLLRVIQEIAACAPGGDASVQTTWAVAVLVQAGRVIGGVTAPSLQDVQGAIQQAADKIKMPRRLRHLLVQHGSVILAMELSSSLADEIAAEQAKQQGLGDTETRRSARGIEQEVYVERMVKGRRRKNDWYPLRVIRENRRNPRYDIVVDEYNREVLVRNNTLDHPGAAPVPHGIDELSTTEAGALWFFLVHFGETITFQQLCDFFGVSKGKTESGIYKPRSALKRILGDGLRRRLIKPPSDDRYAITRNEVNFCWIRKSEHLSESELIYRAGRSMFARSIVGNRSPSDQ